MVNYQLGKIYKIEPITGGDDGDIYIGSTTKEWLSQRMSNHRYKFLKKDDKKHSTSSRYLFEKYGSENLHIILLGSYSCNSKDELLAHEARYIKKLKCVNKYIPLRSCKDYRDEHKDDIRLYYKQYYDNNRTKISNYGQLYRCNNKQKIKQRISENVVCECGLNSTRQHLRRHKTTQRHFLLLNEKNNNTV